jgi:hypothetical protein
MTCRDLTERDQEVAGPRRGAVRDTASWNCPKPTGRRMAMRVCRVRLCALTHRLAGLSAGRPGQCGAGLPSGVVAAGLHAEGEAAGCPDGSAMTGETNCDSNGE